MIKIENVETNGWEAAIRGMRNPMNSWEQSDSDLCSATTACDKHTDSCDCGGHCVGKADFKLMKSLANAGPDHGKFLRFITVSLDITAPLYWWKEFDTYKVGTVANSCSTMHKIHVKEFTLEDFSHEHLTEFSKTILERLIVVLNGYRTSFLVDKDKADWWQLIQLLPTSYNQRRTVLLNYQVLKSMYHARKHHKLDEWRTFCEFIKTLPATSLVQSKSSPRTSRQHRQRYPHETSSCPPATPPYHMRGGKYRRSTRNPTF